MMKMKLKLLVLSKHASSSFEVRMLEYSIFYADHPPSLQTRVIKILFSFFFLLPSFTFSQAQQDYTQFVDPFIGSQGGGNVFVGACQPFGMVKLGPDYQGHSNSGYLEEGPIEGFSHTHVSGTGGGAKYGNILLTASSKPIDPADYTSEGKRETCKAGFYSVYLNDAQTQVELTSSRRVGFHRYTFEGNEGHVLLDAGHYLYTGREYGADRYRFGEAQYLVGSEVNVLSSTSASGYTRVRNGWNLGDTYTVYFYALFDTPAKEHQSWEQEVGRTNPEMPKKPGLRSLLTIPTR